MSVKFGWGRLTFAETKLQTNLWKICKFNWASSSQATSFKLGEYNLLPSILKFWLQIVLSSILEKLFAIRFPYKHCNFWPLCLPVKMASKTVRVIRSVVSWFRTYLHCMKNTFSEVRTIQNLEIISFICRGFETIRNFLFQNIKCVRHFELPTRIVITICVWFDCDRRPSWIKTMHRTKPRWNPNSFRFSANEEKIKRISGWFLSTSLNWC